MLVRCAVSGCSMLKWWGSGTERYTVDAPSLKVYKARLDWVQGSLIWWKEGPSSLQREWPILKQTCFQNEHLLHFFEVILYWPTCLFGKKKKLLNQPQIWSLELLLAQLLHLLANSISVQHNVWPSKEKLGWGNEVGNTAHYPCKLLLRLRSTWRNCIGEYY